VEQPVTCGLGACEASGTLVCEDGVPIDTCTPKPPAATDDDCDGVDDDCDGSTDEDAACSEATGVGGASQGGGEASGGDGLGGDGPSDGTTSEDGCACRGAASDGAAGGWAAWSALAWLVARRRRSALLGERGRVRGAVEPSRAASTATSLREISK
jgi:MYXO-CTERM domain-containing protein